eukprot:gene1064-1612_t
MTRNDVVLYYKRLRQTKSKYGSSNKKQSNIRDTKISNYAIISCAILSVVVAVSIAVVVSVYTIGSNNSTAPPTSVPTAHPAASPTHNPTAPPTSVPTAHPAASPTHNPTAPPTRAPIDDPPSSPTISPSPALHEKFVYVVNARYDGNVSPSKNLRSEFVDEFYTLDSMRNADDLSTNVVAGVDIYGDFVDDAGSTLRQSGLKTASELSKWPLTYAAGHPYYESDTNSWGKLRGGSWGAHVRSTAKELNLTQVSNFQGNRSILVVEDENRTGDCVFRLGHSRVDLLGIVVRKNAVLLIDEIDMTIRVGFILVESGGLLQAGSHHHDAYRFDAHLQIVFTHDYWVDAGNAPVTAGQYSAEVLHPGVRAKKPDGAPNQTVDYFNHSLNNAGVIKGAAIFFNGNYQLNGAVPQSVAYTGTWRATGWRGESVRPLTLNVTDSTEWARSGLPSSYAMTWARLGRSAYPGDTRVLLDSEDCGEATETGMWRSGDRVVLTGAPYHYSQWRPYSQSRATGMQRLWMDHEEETADHEANERSNSEHTSYFVGTDHNDTGVEVATVSVMTYDSNSSACALTLLRPLRYFHYSGYERLRNDALSDDDEGTEVQTTTHVGLLSHRIVVTSELNEGGGGCNNIPSDALSPRVGMNGSLVENYIDDDAATVNGDAADVQQVCMLPHYLRRANRTRPPKGSWLFGTTGLTGCNAIYGAQQKFRYGSSVSLDGVEVTRMSTPANFGKLGTYGVHFHLAGYPRTFKGYLRDEAHSRELRIVSSSIWRTYGRWVTVHGTMEAEVRNNVGFLTYGSGFFCEDGTEMANEWDHNLGIAALTTINNSYWNPSSIAGFVNTDYAIMSTIWMKNNQNAVTRNVMTGSPSPVIGLWYVPQRTAKLRGPSNICVGSEELGLPGVASYGNARAANSPISMSMDGAGMSGAAYAGRDDHRHCYAPDNFATDWRYHHASSHCNIYTEDQRDTPILLNSENVAYAMAGFASEFPEMINGAHRDVGTTPSFLWNGACDTHPETATGADHCNFILPRDGWNACTDQFAEAEYLETTWSDGLGYQSMDPSVYDCSSVDDDPVCCGTVLASQVQSDRSGSGKRAVPKIYANVLVWRIGSMYNTFRFGALWTKNAPSWIINSAFLSSLDDPCVDTDATTCAVAYTVSDTITKQHQFLATQSIHGYDFPGMIIGMLAVSYNLLLKGGYPIPLHTDFVGGNATLIDSSSWYTVDGEGLSKSDQANGYVPAQGIFVSGKGGIANQIENLLENGRTALNKDYEAAADQYDLNSALQLVDLDANTFSRAHFNGTSMRFLKRNNATFYEAVSDTPKYIMLCGTDGLLSASETTAHLVAGEPAAHFVIGKLFASEVGTKIGDDICRSLAMIPTNMAPSTREGDAFDASRMGQITSCRYVNLTYVWPTPSPSPPAPPSPRPPPPAPRNVRDCDCEVSLARESYGIVDTCELRTPTEFLNRCAVLKRDKSVLAYACVGWAPYDPVTYEGSDTRVYGNNFLQLSNWTNDFDFCTGQNWNDVSDQPHSFYCDMTPCIFPENYTTVRCSAERCKALSDNAKSACSGADVCGCCFPMNEESPVCASNKFYIANDEAPATSDCCEHACDASNCDMT